MKKKKTFAQLEDGSKTMPSVVDLKDIARETLSFEPVSPMRKVGRSVGHSHRELVGSLRETSIIVEFAFDKAHASCSERFRTRFSPTIRQEFLT